MTPKDDVIERMQAQIDTWEAQGDRRAIFLTCYTMMTRNMLAAVERGEFADPVWVGRLLDHFAEYYFVALEGYEARAAIPGPWRLAFEAAGEPGWNVIQHLLLGVNAHINYDLVLATCDLLDPEWAAMPESQRASRYQDYCLVNTIIAQTIDAVQDQVLERYSPGLDWIDRGLGRLDEWMIARLVSSWREEVWKHTLRRVETPLAAGREALRLEVEGAANQTARQIAHWGGFLAGAV